jgi:hypothetical protein
MVRLGSSAYNISLSWYRRIQFLSADHSCTVCIGSSTSGHLGPPLLWSHLFSLFQGIGMNLLISWQWFSGVTMRWELSQGFAWVWLVDWATSMRSEEHRGGGGRNYLSILSPLTSLFVPICSTFHFFSDVYTATNDNFYVLCCLITFFFLFYYSWVAMMIPPIRELLYFSSWYLRYSVLFAA